MPKEDYIPVCEYDQKHKCDGTRWFECQHGDSGLSGQHCIHVVYTPKEFFEPEDEPKPALVPAEYTISKLEDSLEKAKEIIHFAMSLEKHPTFISVNLCKNGDAYVTLNYTFSYDEDENEGE